MTDTDPPAPLTLLMEILAAAGMWCGDCGLDLDDEPCSECRDVRAGFADAILSDPRIAVVQLPEVEPESFDDGPLHAKLPHAQDRYPRAQRRHDGRIALSSIHNPFRTDVEAADTAAAILAILHNTNNRGDQS